MALKCKLCKDTGIRTTWDRLLPFNANSSDQVKAVFRALHLTIPKKRGEDRETTEAKYLKRLKKRFPAFGGILDVRKRQKLISDYLWQPDSNSTIRTTYGFHPTTWRKSSRGPNLQVIPRPDDENELPGLVRETITAPPGYVLLEADSAGIEAVLVAYDVGSPKMLKVAQAGIHGYFQSHVMHDPVDWQLPLPELTKACKRFKKLDHMLYDKCKRVVHGTHYGLTPFGMADEYEEVFLPQPGDKEKSAKAVAERFQSSYFALLPELKLWMARIREQAHTQRFLDNNFGYRHYFYDVFSWDARRQQYILGTDGKRCIAFKPQSNGSACQSEYILRLEELADQEPNDSVWALLRSTMRLLIHDSLVFCIPESEAKVCAQATADIMNMAIPELGGLRIGVEVKAGPNMREQSVIEVVQQFTNFDSAPHSLVSHEGVRC